MRRLGRSASADGPSLLPSRCPSMRVLPGRRPSPSPRPEAWLGSARRVRRRTLVCRPSRSPCRCPAAQRRAGTGSLQRLPPWGLCIQPPIAGRAASAVTLVRRGWKGGRPGSSSSRVRLSRASPLAEAKGLAGVPGGPAQNTRTPPSPSAPPANHPLRPEARSPAHPAAMPPVSPRHMTMARRRPDGKPGVGRSLRMKPGAIWPPGPFAEARRAGRVWPAASAAGSPRTPNLSGSPRFSITRASQLRCATAGLSSRAPRRRRYPARLDKPAVAPPVCGEAESWRAE